MHADPNTTGLYNEIEFLLSNDTALILVPSLEFNLFKSVYGDLCTDLRIELSKVDDHYICFVTLVGCEWCTKGA